MRVNVLGHDIPFDVAAPSDWDKLKSQIDPATNTVAPDADDNYFTGSHDNNLVVGNVLSNDDAVDSDQIFARLISGTQHGSLKLNADGSFDYRPLAGFIGFDYFTYEAIDGLFKSESTVTLEITNAASVLGLTFSIPENSPNNTIIGTTLATDADAGETLAYLINSGNESGAFAINASGQLEVANTSLFDYETTPLYTLNITVTDSLGLTDTANITINVTGVNESPTISSPATANVDENTTAVLDLAASDPEGFGLAYIISGGADRLLFSVDANTRVLSFIAAPDHEIPADDGSDNVYNVQVTVTDSGSLTDVQDLVITVDNINESPTILAGQTFSIDENSASSTSVGLVEASDVDTEQSSLTYSMVDSILKCNYFWVE